DRRTRTHAERSGQPMRTNRSSHHHPVHAGPTGAHLLPALRRGRSMPPMTGPLAFALLLAGATFGQALSPFQQLRAEDRDIQRAGAQALVASCDGCTPHLLGIWRTTERFDVRAHIALILERLGPEG